MEHNSTHAPCCSIDGATACATRSPPATDRRRLPLLAGTGSAAIAACAACCAGAFVALALSIAGAGAVLAGMHWLGWAALALPGIGWAILVLPWLLHKRRPSRHSVAALSLATLACMAVWLWLR